MSTSQTKPKAESGVKKTIEQIAEAIVSGGVSVLLEKKVPKEPDQKQQSCRQ